MKLIKKDGRTTLERDCYYCSSCFKKRQLCEFQFPTRFPKFNMVCEICINQRNKDYQRRKALLKRERENIIRNI